jgi:putative DNA primase/helicase
MKSYIYPEQTQRQRMGLAAKGITAANPLIQKVLSCLERVRQTNDGYMALCPCHDDNNLSLSIRHGQDGRVLLYCHAGCDFDAICAATGLDAKDLFPAEPANKPKKREVAVYDYTDEDGNLLFQKVRYEPKDFRCRVLDGSGGWTYTINGVRRILYNLPAVIESRIVFIVEGEKDANLLIQNGYTATCNFDGAGKDNSKWRPEYNPYFQGKSVYLVPDNDLTGKRHCAAIYDNLKDVAADIRIVELPGLADKSDVSDFFANGGTIEEFNQVLMDAPTSLPLSFMRYDSNNTADTDQEQWRQPLPFDETVLPPFPLDGLPSCLFDFAQIVREVSVSNQTPPDMAALLLLTIASSCLGGKVKVVTNNRYTELATLYTAIFAPSGTRKSSVYHALMKPVIDYQRQLRADMKPGIESNKNELDLLERSKERIKKDIAKGVDNCTPLREELQEIEKQLAEFDKPTELPLMFMETDFTVESLAPKIRDNEGTLSLFDHEGAFWDEVAGRYSQTQSQTNDLLLKGYDGSPVMITRIGRGDIFIDACSLAIGLIVQPTKIEDLKNKKGLEETGLIPRFILSVPADNIGFRQMETPPVSHYVCDNYRHKIESLISIRYRRETVLTMSDRAKQLFMEFGMSTEERLRDGSDLYLIRAWASKLPGRIARIAAVLHCYATPHDLDSRTEIAADIMEYAIGLSEYLIQHAKETYQILNLSPDIQRAKKILCTLTRYVRSANRLFISKGDLWQRVKNSDKSMRVVASLSGALEILEDHNFIRQVEPENKKNGRPSEEYELNPKYFSKI